VNAVTGVFSYTGRAIAEELLARGDEVRTLSRADAPGDPLRDKVEVASLRFDESLADSLAGVRTLYNTYGSDSRVAESATKMPWRTRSLSSKRRGGPGSSGLCTFR